jgi:septal ring factor EnvC (AmiA/AmiB activator)
MRGKAIFSIKWADFRPVLCASALSAGVLLCAFSAHADDRDQLKSIQADIAAKERAVRQQQQQRGSLQAQLKEQEVAISAAARALRETQNTLAELNKQVAEMSASLARLEKQKDSQERNLAAQLDAAFRQGEHTGMQMLLSGEETQRGQRLQAYFGYLNQARQETIAQLKQTREEVASQKAALEEKQSQQQTLLYEQRAQQAKLEQALNERKKTLSRSSLARCVPTNPACAAALPKQKQRPKPVPSVKPVKRRPFAIASRKPPAKAPPTSQRKVKNR